MADRKQGMDILLSEREYVPTIIQTQLLNDIAGILYEQLAVMKDAIPDLFKKYEFDVTSTVLELTSDVLSTFPWISATIYNVGGKSVHVYINEYGIEDSDASGMKGDPPLASGDTFSIDMQAPKIKKMFFVCDAGETTTVRLFVTCKNFRETAREEINI